MHFSLIKAVNPGTLPSHGFDDAILPMFFALQRLGYEVEIRVGTPNPRSRNIVFGSCIAPRITGRQLPKNSIIVNLEQLVPGSMWLNNNYLAHLYDFTVWDFSRGNVEMLKSLGIQDVHYLPNGYVPEMTRLLRDLPKDIDALFYGLVNERRRKILAGLEEKGIKVLAAPSDSFGNARDALLARSRLVLNIHFRLPATLETVRLGYPWANQIPVISEMGADTDIPPELAEACAYYPHDQIVGGVSELVGQERTLARIGEKGFEAFRSLALTDILRERVGSRKAREGSTVRPNSLPVTGISDPALYLPGVSSQWLIEAGDPQVQP